MNTNRTKVIKRIKHFLCAKPPAKSICWDGCHKIYVLGDEDTHEAYLTWDYTPMDVSDLPINQIADILAQWFEDSCPLRFISYNSMKWTDKMRFEDIIHQIDAGKYNAAGSKQPAFR